MTETTIDPRKYGHRETEPGVFQESLVQEYLGGNRKVLDELDLKDRKILESAIDERILTELINAEMDKIIRDEEVNGGSGNFFDPYAPSNAESEPTQQDTGSSSSTPDASAVIEPSDSEPTVSTPSNEDVEPEPQGPDSPTSGSSGGGEPPDGGEPEDGNNSEGSSDGRGGILGVIVPAIIIACTAFYFLFIRGSNISLVNVGISTLVIVVGLALATGLFLLFAYALSFFDIFFTQVPSGESKFVVKGETFHKLLACVEGSTFDPKTYEKIRLKPGQKDPNRSWLNNFGIFWIGIWPFFKVYKYRFSWDKPIRVGEGYSKDKVEHRENEIVDSMINRYPYAIIVAGSEIGSYISYNFFLVVTIEATNPVKAMFDIKPSGSWLIVLQARVQDAVRAWVSNQNVENVLKIMSDKDGKDNFIRGGITHINDGLGEKTGVIVDEMQVVTVDPIINDSKISDALTAKVRAQEEGKATVAKADAEAEAIRLVAKANQDRIQATLIPLLQLPGGSEAIAAEAIRDALTGNQTATTLVLGGQAPGLMINPPSNSGRTDQTAKT